ncbi:5'-methylthioadenosine/S-adenosylhomocysteine nucleosidase, partial [Actinoplanes philippinensis]
AGWVSFPPGGQRAAGFALIGKGQERAAAASAMVISQFEPAVVVNLGIAGSISDDVSLGDVVVADQVVSYMANSKVKPTGSDGFRFEPAGEALRSDEFLVDRLRQIPLVSPSKFDDWTRRAQLSVRREAGRDDPNVATVHLHVGPVASGPAVVGATAFKNWMKGTKRDYLAVEMESSGVAIAAELSGMLRRVRFLALRGISDAADEQKNQLEKESKGSVRGGAMENALDLLMILLDGLSPEIYRRLKR